MRNKLIIDEQIKKRLENVKLIVTDIDGTLLKSDGTVGQWTRQLFTAARNMGIHTAIATGRAVDALPKAVLEMSCFEYVISCNGTSIYANQEGMGFCQIYDCKMPKALVQSVTEIFRAYDFPLEAVVDGKAYVTKAYYENPLMLALPEHMFDYVRSTRYPAEDIYEFIRENIEKIESMTMVIDNQEIKAQVREKVEKLPDIYVTSSVHHYIECNHEEARKGATMIKLGRLLGIEPEQVMAFGDSENDLDMLAAAGVSVAMGNGQEEVMAMADIVTFDNNTEGVAAVMAQMPAFSSDIFLYEITENGAVITGLTEKGKTEKYLTVPGSLGGCAVKTIGDHAFYENKALLGVTLSDTVTQILNYGFAECRNLEHVQMSLNIESIGDYAFYNCHSLKSVVLPVALKNMGYGAYKNCSVLTEVFLHTDGVQALAAGALFDDTSHEMNVYVCDISGNILTSLVLTEFDYDCILQVEARQFDWVYHGSGNVYRQCITKKGIDYAKYDSLFSAAVHEDWPETALKIALGRVVYPYRLTEEHQKRYVEYLRNHKQAVFKYYLKTQQAEIFGKVLEMIADEDTLREWIGMAQDKKAMGFVSILMDYQQKHYGRRKKTFEL